jgi:hypothetical protein
LAIRIRSSASAIPFESHGLDNSARNIGVKAQLLNDLIGQLHGNLHGFLSNVLFQTNRPEYTKGAKTQGRKDGKRN